MRKKAESIRDEYYLLRMIPSPKKAKEAPKEEKVKEDVEETIDLDAGDEEYPEDN